MNAAPRVAFFADSFHEVNGVALTSRQFEAFARRRQLPFLSIHAGPETKFEAEGSVSTLELQRGSAAFALETDLFFDPLLWRYKQRVVQVLKSFEPDLIHVTGPNDLGMLGSYVAHNLKVPLVASWHTNVHEYAARRLEKLLSFIPEKPLRKVSAAAERHALYGTALFYKTARMLFAPNQELMHLLHERTGKPCHLMQRGVDAEAFDPARRDPGARPFTIGFVGRLSAEKNVRFLAEIERALLTAGKKDFRFLIVGAGSELDWLSANMTKGEFAGLLKGEELARAYANMDVFAFPSYTDTFGNVILEALASGVPAVVTTGGGPKFLVRSGVTGFVAADDRAFMKCVLKLMDEPELLRQMKLAARQQACSISWDRVFEQVYEKYATLFPPAHSFRAAS